MDHPPPGTRPARPVAAGMALALAVAAAVWLALAPTGTRTSVSTVDGVTPPPVVEHPSLIDVNGSGVLVVLLVPVALAGAGLLAGAAAPSRRPVYVVAAVALWAFALLGSMSVGLFYTPAALAMTLAAVRERPVSRRRGGQAVDR